MNKNTNNNKNKNILQNTCIPKTSKCFVYSYGTGGRSGLRRQSWKEMEEGLNNGMANLEEDLRTWRLQLGGGNKTG